MNVETAYNPFLLYFRKYYETELLFFIPHPHLAQIHIARLLQRFLFVNLGVR